MITPYTNENSLCKKDQNNIRWQGYGKKKKDFNMLLVKTEITVVSMKNNMEKILKK